MTCFGLENTPQFWVAKIYTYSKQRQLTRQLSGAIAAILIYAPATALNADTEEEFGNKVREYLLENPEVILEVMDVLSERQEALAAKAMLTPHIKALFNTELDLRIGDANAPRIVIEFFDYNCAVCIANVPVMREFVAENPDVAIVKKHLPILSPGSARAVRFVLAARQIYGMDSYIRLHDRIYSKLGPLSLRRLSEFAEDLDLDPERIANAMQSREISELIDTHREIAIALQIVGTPTFASKDMLHVGRVTADILTALANGS